MSSIYLTQASALQDSVRESELKALEEGKGCSAEQANMATINARLDNVLIVSLLDSANQQLATVRRLMWAVVIVFALSMLPVIFMPFMWGVGH